MKLEKIEINTKNEKENITKEMEEHFLQRVQEILW